MMDWTQYYNQQGAAGVDPQQQTEPNTPLQRAQKNIGSLIQKRIEALSLGKDESERELIEFDNQLLFDDICVQLGAYADKYNIENPRSENRKDFATAFKDIHAQLSKDVLTDPKAQSAEEVSEAINKILKDMEQKAEDREKTAKKEKAKTVDDAEKTREERSVIKVKVAIDEIFEKRIEKEEDVIKKRQLVNKSNRLQHEAERRIGEYVQYYNINGDDGEDFSPNHDEHVERFENFVDELVSDIAKPDESNDQDIDISKSFEAIWTTSLLEDFNKKFNVHGYSGSLKNLDDVPDKAKENLKNLLDKAAARKSDQRDSNRNIKNSKKKIQEEMDRVFSEFKERCNGGKDYNSIQMRAFRKTYDEISELLEDGYDPENNKQVYAFSDYAPKVEQAVVNELKEFEKKSKSIKANMNAEQGIKQDVEKEKSWHTGKKAAIGLGIASALAAGVVTWPIAGPAFFSMCVNAPAVGISVGKGVKALKEGNKSGAAWAFGTAAASIALGTAAGAGLESLMTPEPEQLFDFAHRFE